VQFKTDKLFIAIIKLCYVDLMQVHVMYVWLVKTMI